MKPKLALTEKLELAWRDWNDAIIGLDDADCTRMIYPRWNLKDVIGHVFAYLDLHLRHIQSYKKYKRLASPRAPSYGYFNRREAERLRSVPLTQIRADMASEYRELMALVPTLTSDDLKKEFPAQWTSSQYKTSLRYQLRSMADHMRIHANEVKEWRKQNHGAGQ